MNNSLEQQARELLKRLEIENVDTFSNGELVELAKSLNRSG